VRIVVLLIALFLPLSGLAEGNDVPTITVRGEAITKLAPDQVTLPVTIREENINLQVAKQKHDEKLRTLLKLAGDNDIARENIQTGYTSVSPQYEYTLGVQHLRGYQVETSVDFKLTNIEKLGTFMNSVVTAGIDNIGSVNYSLKEEEKIKEDTLVLAVGVAHDKAARLAVAAKMSLGTPLDITEGSVEINRPIPRFAAPRGMMAMSSANAAPAPELPAGLVEIHQTVTITYQLK
jgi:uncharacterized protein YggE